MRDAQAGAGSSRVVVPPAPVRVVVTGLGATTPLGGDVRTTWEAALAGRSGARTLTNDWAERYGLPVTFAAPAAVQPDEVLDPSELRRMDPGTRLAVVASREAWVDAGSPVVDPERLAVVIATSIGGIHTFTAGWDALRESGASCLPLLSASMAMPNAAAVQVSLELGARAGARTPVSACASGSEAVATGAGMIRAGAADVVVVGGTDAAIHPFPLAGLAAMHALSTRNDDPAGASRPFAVDRDGFVLGEGAAVLVLERAGHARARGARVYAEVAGVGITSDAHSVFAPAPSGAGEERAMRLALADAGAGPDEVAHVNAHATSTPVGDAIEAAAIGRVLEGSGGVAVSATKSMTGHLLGGAGALESVLTVLALVKRLAPPTINVAELDPAVGLEVVRDLARPLPDGPISALNNAFGFGGHNVTLLFRSM